jgi:hypothetical protein
MPAMQFRAVYAYNESFLGVGRTDEEAKENTIPLLSCREELKIVPEPKQTGDMVIVTITGKAKLYLEKWGGDPDLVLCDDGVYYSPEEVEDTEPWFDVCEDFEDED